MPAIARTFTPAAPQRVTPAVVRAPAVRTTSRTTARTPPTAVNPSASLSRLRQVAARNATSQITFAKPQPHPKSILEQFGDLVIGLPQGLVGFGKDVLTDTLVVPHTLLDLVKDQKLRSISDYLPASTGLVKSFGHTAYDITHPSEFADAWKEGRIVGKLVEDIGNVAIVGGGISKALGAGAASGIMSAEEAAAIPTRYGVAATPTGRTLEEAAAAGVKVPSSGALADAAQFGGREMAEYAIPKRGLAGMVQASNPELAGQLQRAGNVVRTVTNWGERAGNLPIKPYAYAGRGLNKLAEAAGLEGGLTGAVSRAATKVAPNIMYRGSAEGQIVRGAQAETERLGTRATRFSYGANQLADELGLTDVEKSAVLSMVDTPNLGMGLEHLDDTQLGELLNSGYAGVEADLRPTVALTRKVMQYRDQSLPADKLAAMDRVLDEVTGISQARTQRALGPVPGKLEPGTPAEPGSARPVLPYDTEAVNAAYDKLSGAEADAVDAAVKAAMYDDVFNKRPQRELDEYRAEEMARRGHIPTPAYRGAEAPGVTPGRPIVGETPTGLHPEQLGNDLLSERVAAYQHGLERPRDIMQRRAESAHDAALRESRIYDAMVAVNDTLPEAPSARTEFNKGVARERVRGTDRIARRRWEQAQRALDQALRDYVKIADGPPSAMVERAAKEVDRLTLEVNRVRDILQRHERRVDAATALSQASGEVEPGAPRIAGETGPAYNVRQAEARMEGSLSELQGLNERYGLPQRPTPEIAGVGRQPQEIRARAKQIGEEAAYEAEGAIDALTGGDRPTMPSKGMAGGEYDWFYELDAPTRRRLQREGWVAGKGTRGTGPDVLAETINRNLGTNLSTDAAMSRWVDAVRRYWDTKAGTSVEVIDRVATELGLPPDQITAAIRGRIADYGPLLTENVQSAFGELRDSFQRMTPDDALSFNATADAMLMDPGAFTTGDFADLLESYFPELDVTSPQGIMTTIDGMADIPEVVDWMRGGTATEFPERIRAKMQRRGPAQQRQLGQLEGRAQGARARLRGAEGELAGAEHQQAVAEGAAARAEATAERRVGRAVTAEEVARPEQGPKLAETLRPGTPQATEHFPADPYRRRGDARLSPADRARIKEGMQRQRAMEARAKANRLRKSVDRYNERIAGAHDELSRTFQDRMHEDVNIPAVKQLTSAVASGGKDLGNIVGEGDGAALNGVIATIGTKYHAYDDLVLALDDARSEKARAALGEAAHDEYTADMDFGELTDKVKPKPLSPSEVAGVVNEVLRRRTDIVLDVPDSHLLEDAIGRSTLLDDMASTMLDEADGGRRLNSPYRIKDVIDNHSWNMPAETRNRIEAAWERFQARRANTLSKVYNQWSAAVPARFRPAVQAGQRQISALLEMAEKENRRSFGSGDIYLDMAESTSSTLSQMVEQGFDPAHLTGGRPAAQSSAATAAYGSGLGQKSLRGEHIRRTGLRQITMEAYSRVEAEQALKWVNNQRNTYLEGQVGVRADAIPEVQAALADWAEEHPGETMPPRTLGEAAASVGYVPITGKDVGRATVLIPKAVFDVLEPSSYKIPGLKALSRSNQAFKTWVLPFSPKWQIGNVLGNVIQAAVHGGISPLELVRTMNRIRRYEGGIANLWRHAGLPEWTRAEIANHGLTIDEYRIARGLEDKQPRTFVGKLARKSFKLNEFVDNLTRSSVDLAKLAKGESSDAALQSTLRTLGDYTRMSNFERKIVREVIPFYAWLRHSTIATLRLPITSPTRAAFVLHLADIYKDPDEQSDLFGSRIPFMGGLLNIGTISPLQDVESMTPGGFLGPASSPTLKAIAGIGFGFDLNKMAAITRPDSTAQLDAYGKPKTTSPLTQLFRDPAAGLGEIGWQLSQQGPSAIKNLRDYVLGDDVRYSGTGYRVGTLQDPRRRSLATLMRAVNLPTLDPLPDTRS